MQPIPKVEEFGTESLWVANLALPDRQYIVPQRTEFTFFASIPFSVVEKLFLPKRTIPLRNSGSGTIWMRMPEAPVNENHLPSTLVDEVGAPRQIPDVQAVPCTVVVQ